MLYKDFNDYWRNGQHGCSSCSRDVAEETWKDLEETIMASRGDWEQLLVEDCKRQKEQYLQDLRDMHEYLKEFDLEKVAGIKFHRWLLDKRLGRGRYQQDQE